MLGTHYTPWDIMYDKDSGEVDLDAEGLAQLSACSRRWVHFGLGDRRQVLTFLAGLPRQFCVLGLLRAGAAAPPSASEMRSM